SAIDVNTSKSYKLEARSASILQCFSEPPLTSLPYKPTTKQIFSIRMFAYSDRYFLKGRRPMPHLVAYRLSIDKLVRLEVSPGRKRVENMKTHSRPF